MDFATLERILVNYGVPMVIMLLGMWAGWIAANRLVKALWPMVVAWFTEERIEREKRLETMDKQSVAVTQQTPLIAETHQIVHSISDRQLDPESQVSNVHTLQKLNQLLDNDASSKLVHQKFAKAGIEACEGLIRDYPEMSSRLQSAISTLREIENHA